MKIQYYTAKGTKTKQASLPKALSGKVNDDLLAQAFHVYRSRSHGGRSKTQTRADVSLTTAKWYKQKGTGRARHGAKSAPIFVGGGKAHGAKGLKRELKLSSNLKTKALVTALNQKASEGALVVVTKIADIKKTKDAAGLLNKILGDTSKKATLILTKESKDTWRAFRNIKNCEFALVSSLNAYNVLLGGTLVFEDTALKNLEKQLS